MFFLIQNHYKCLSYVYKRQILTYKDSPRTETVNTWAVRMLHPNSLHQSK